MNWNSNPCHHLVNVALNTMLQQCQQHASVLSLLVTCPDHPDDVESAFVNVESHNQLLVHLMLLIKSWINQFWNHEFMKILTNINKTSWWSFTKLFTFIRQCYFHNTWYMSWWCMHSDRMRCYQFTPHQHCAKDHLQAIKEIVTNYNNMGATCCPSFARWHCFNAWRCHW